MPYAVQTPVFEGPFDLLLHLILRDQVDLYEVALTDIVDAYLAELDRLEAFDLDTYDRLTILTKEIRRLISEERDVRVHVGSSPPLDHERLKAQLRWI